MVFIGVNPQLSTSFEMGVGGWKSTCSITHPVATKVPCIPLVGVHTDLNRGADFRLLSSNCSVSSQRKVSLKKIDWQEVGLQKIGIHISVFLSR